MKEEDLEDYNDKYEDDKDSYKEFADNDEEE